MVRKIVLSNEDFKKIPGRTSKLSISRLKGMVDMLLTEHGVKNKAWITKEGEDTLIFELDIEIRGVHKALSFQFLPPQIYRRVRRGGRGEWVYEEVYEEAASWRVFHDLLERMLAAAKLGIMPVHHVLMAFVATPLPDMTFGDVMDVAIAEDKLDKMLAALEDKREPKIVDVIEV